MLYTLAILIHITAVQSLMPITPVQFWLQIWNNIKRDDNPTVQWPRGSFTLLKPKVGCPYGWYQGWRKQDNEDYVNRNWISSGHHFYGTFGNDFEFWYCTKDDHRIPTYGNWPKGNYCILRSSSSCPSGFYHGYLKWDDEDVANTNDYGGVLPSGIFDKDTKINYCCRSDGRASTPIELPTDHPFYLLRHTEPCQRVKGMYYINEIVSFDDEDVSTINKRGGWYPFVGDDRDNHKLYYCYYY